MCKKCMYTLWDIFFSYFFFEFSKHFEPTIIESVPKAHSSILITLLGMSFLSLFTNIESISRNKYIIYKYQKLVIYFGASSLEKTNNNCCRYKKTKHKNPKNYEQY